MPTKPEPLFIDGRYVFTLSSYEPVQITVKVPYVTGQEVAMGLSGVLMSHGYTSAEAPSDAWVAENFEGIKTLDELTAAVREEQERMNQHYADASKSTLCAAAISERLEQSIPAELVERARESLKQGYEDQVAQSGFELSAVIASMGMSEADFNAMLDAQAATIAAEDAALDAVAAEYALYAEETELPGILGLSPAEAKAIVDDARESGAFDGLMRHAVRCKAANILLDEAEVTYEHEDKEAAERRVAEMMAERASWTAPGGCCGGGCGGGGCCGGGDGECGCGGDCDCDGDGECGCGGNGDGCCCGGHDEAQPSDGADEHPHLKLV